MAREATAALSTPSGFRAPAPLGVGCSYPPSLPGVIDRVGDLVDFVEISPDMLCRQVETGPGPSMTFVEELLGPALAATAGLPTVVHGLELSIGTASGWNQDYVDLLDRFAMLRPFPWHSEHLGFTMVAGADGRPVQTGVPLPLPFTRQALDVVVPRAAAMAARYGVPFLLENAAYYLRRLPADPGWDEISFLNALTAESSCGLLLDLYNLYCNSVNHHFDPLAALQRVRLDRVVEVHVAGGFEEAGFRLDSHSDAMPPEVREMVAWLLPRAPNLAGLVFEVQEPALPAFGVDALRAELTWLRTAWDRR